MHGTNVKTALRYEPANTRATLIALVADVCRFLDMTKTLETSDDYIFCVEGLVDQFPAMKLEEWRIVTQRMKMGYYGKYFNRLKMAEFAEAFLAHEAERQPYIEQMNTAHQVTRGVDDVSQIKHIPQSMADLRRKRAQPIFDLAANLAQQERERTEKE